MSTDYDDRIYSNRLAYDAEEEVSYRLTWEEVVRQQTEQISELLKWQRICSDLDRCEHGRHESDVCSSCGGPSKGNTLIGHGPIGHGMDTEHIRVPERAIKHDPDEWRVHGPCRDTNQIGTPCPIGPVRRVVRSVGGIGTDD